MKSHEDEIPYLIKVFIKCTLVFSTVLKIYSLAASMVPINQLDWFPPEGGRPTWTGLRQLRQGLSHRLPRMTAIPVRG